MNPKHNNPTPTLNERIAHAPYNFVPLPEQIVQVNYEIPDHDNYIGNTGYLDCTLITLTPTYTRTALNPEFFSRWGDNIREMMRDDQARKTYARFFHLDDAQRPIISGSSLRGMTRALIEIVGYGKMAWVRNEPKVTFRAVAAARDEPLKQPYDQVLGRFGRKVRAGYLLRKNDDWFVQPALLPSNLGWPGQDAYLKVKDGQISASAIPGYMVFNDPYYRPQYHEVSFDVQVRNGKLGKYVAISKIGTIASAYGYNGLLVCSGNMLETGKPGQPSPRTNHAIVLSPNNQAMPINIRKQSIVDYCSGLTSFQKEPPFDSQMGCLLEGRPIFYVEEGGKIIAFGHSPNFRIPYWLDDTMQAAAPLDLVPKKLRQHTDTKGNDIIDIAEAIFGFTAEGRKLSRAGRVFFTDAICEPGQENIWLPEGIITPQILGGPNPTTFQHYLVQDREKGHDPDQKLKLAHYGTPTPDATVIRGHKFYWHKQKGLASKDFSESRNPDWESDTQHTQIKPVAANKRFRFKVYFENLTDVELGALLWVLDLPEGYHHKIGMGKPLGLGSITIEPHLVITNRSERYSKLLDDSGWHTGEDTKISEEKFRRDFECHILEHMDQKERDGAQEMCQLLRIQMLLKMLEWPGPNPNSTGYMTIDPNQYKERPVLPDPLEVGLHKGVSSFSPKMNTGGITKISKSYNSHSAHKSAGLIWLEDTAKDLKINLDGLLKRPNDLPKRWMGIQESKLKSEVLKEIVAQLKISGIWENPPTKKLEKMIQFFKSQEGGQD